MRTPTDRARPGRRWGSPGAGASRFCDIFISLERAVGVAFEAAPQEEIAELVEGHRQIARGLGVVGVRLVQALLDLEAVFISLERAVGVAFEAAPQEEIAELVEGDRQIARGLGVVGVRLVQALSNLEAVFISLERAVGVAFEAAPQEEIAELVEDTDRSRAAWASLGFAWCRRCRVWRLSS